MGEIEVSDPDLDEIRNDFYKVLDAKARLKVFVCAPPSRRMVERLRQEIDRGVEHQLYRLKEERLVTVLLEYDGRRDRYLASVRLFDGARPLRRWRRGWES